MRKTETHYLRPTNIADKLRNLQGRNIVHVKQNGKRETGGEIAITVI